MNSAMGNALEWALVLLKAPAERHALRQSPLPPGIERLLAIAAGIESEESLAATAASLGESQSRLREAAQFYAREVLFHPHADAYRTLGVATDASLEQIKVHHRLLQLWLHPDRQQGEDDSVFAARVNIAWNRLRNEERRRAYDRDLAEAREAMAEEGADGIDSMRRMAPAWLPVTPPPPAPEPWRHRLPVVALCAVCLLLGWLAVRHSQREPEHWEWAEQGASVQAVPAAAEAALATPSSDAAGSTPLPSQAKPREAPATAPLELSAKVLAALAGMVDSEPPPEPLPDVAQPGDLVATEAPVARPRLAMAEQPALPKATVVTSAEREKPVRVALVAEPEPDPEPAPPVPAPSTAPLLAKVPARAAREATPEVRAPLASRSKPAATAVSAPAPARGPGEPDIVRIEQAQRVGAQLLAYLATVKRAPPPIWNSPVIMSSADGLRHDLHSHGRARIGAPQWRIGGETASLASDYRVEGVAGPEGRGVVTANMLWREGRWLVVGLGVEQSR